MQADGGGAQRPAGMAARFSRIRAAAGGAPGRAELLAPRPGPEGPGADVDPRRLPVSQLRRLAEKQGLPGLIKRFPGCRVATCVSAAGELVVGWKCPRGHFRAEDADWLAGQPAGSTPSCRTCSPRSVAEDVDALRAGGLAALAPVRGRAAAAAWRCGAGHLFQASLDAVLGLPADRLCPRCRLEDLARRRGWALETSGEIGPETLVCLNCPRCRWQGLAAARGRVGFWARCRCPAGSQGLGGRPSRPARPARPARPGLLGAGAAPPNAPRLPWSGGARSGRWLAQALAGEPAGRAEPPVWPADRPAQSGGLPGSAPAASPLPAELPARPAEAPVLPVDPPAGQPLAVSPFLAEVSAWPAWWAEAPAWWVEAPVWPVDLPARSGGLPAGLAPAASPFLAGLQAGPAEPPVLPVGLLAWQPPAAAPLLAELLAWPAEPWPAGPSVLDRPDGLPARSADPWRLPPESTSRPAPPDGPRDEGRPSLPPWLAMEDEFGAWAGPEAEDFPPRKRRAV